MVKVSNFQSGVITFLVSLKSDKSDLDNLGQIFRTLDTNKDGLLSLKEIREGIEAHQHDFNFTFSSSKKDYQELFEIMDVNCDGKIDYDEFIRAGYNRSKLINLKNLEIAFDQIDYNGDGAIDI